MVIGQTNFYIEEICCIIIEANKIFGGVISEDKMLQKALE